MSTRLKLELHGYWHAGSGRGEGPGADAVVVRTPAGLPYVPGRTLKGLLREAVLQLAQCGQGLEARRVEALFGQRGARTAAEGEFSDDTVDALTKGQGRFEVGSGVMRVSDARLGATRDEQRAWETWAASPSKEKAWKHLFQTLSSTAIEGDTGIARKGSLRSMEVAIPMTLYAFIECEEESDWRKELERALPLLRSLGAKRNRGFGRCTVTLEEVER